MYVDIYGTFVRNSYIPSYLLPSYLLLFIILLVHIILCTLLRSFVRRYLHSYLRSFYEKYCKYHTLVDVYCEILRGAGESDEAHTLCILTYLRSRYFLSTSS